MTTGGVRNGRRDSRYMRYAWLHNRDVNSDSGEDKMSRLIDADKLKEHYAWWGDFDHLRETKKDFDTIIDLQPTVEAEPNTAIETVDWYHQNADGEMVLGANSNQQAWFKADDVFKALKAEPKHGRWLPSDKGDCTYICSECGFVRDAYILEEKAYCPRCGADMREVEE